MALTGYTTNKMKKFFNKFKGKNNLKGYLFMPDKWLRLDYQKHGALALFLSIPFTTFTAHSILKDANDVLAALIASAVIYGIGWFIEFTHKLKPHRQYDPYDAHIMLLMALLGSFIIVLVRSIFYHPIYDEV